MAKVYVLPGVVRREIIGDVPTFDQVIERARDRGVQNVILVGKSPDGATYIDAEDNDLDRVLGRLTRAASFLCDDMQLDDHVDTEENPDAVE